jgi:hypothetical protein
MPGVQVYLRTGPDTFQAMDNAHPVTGGQLVVPDPNNPGGVIPAQAGAVNVLGVARTDAKPRTSQTGQNPANLAQYAQEVSVEYGVDIPVTYAGAAALGDLLVAAANGQVAKYTPQDAAGIVTPAVPASLTPVVNNTAQNAWVTIIGGTMTVVKVNTTTVGTGAGLYFLPVGASITLTYSVAPTWEWDGAGSTHDQVIGRCTEPYGVSQAGVGRARIHQR